MEGDWCSAAAGLLTWRGSNPIPESLVVTQKSKLLTVMFPRIKQTDMLRLQPDD